ncbi:hypothetical protein [Aeoliella mucimassa]|uniref:Uncharacterized protein n=1 Tax=Aeoliella mucimassa TaxID=2527972 RepID=A0A518AS33_9BACT|nr:hypothetical protein [Aeoliella mucimassa]QDU57533.1 hypothetical protein Pan181_37510 [Aeoliella mucimassa]
MRRYKRREIINTHKRLQTARLAGRLIDCSDVAREAGFRFRCEVSVDLWNSLFWKYPSARDHDCVDLVNVLNSTAMRDLLETIDNPFEDKRKLPHHLFVRPPNSPWWVGPRFFVKLFLLYRRGELDLVVVVPETATLTTLFSNYQPPLPATLLVKLLLACRGLHLIARQSEHVSISSLQDTVFEMLRMSPLLDEIKEYHETLDQPVVPAGFTVEEYREVLCRELFELLGIATAVAEITKTDFRMSAWSVLRLLATLVSMMPLQAATTIAQKTALLH